MTALQHDKPIVFIDLETTGTNPVSDRIVEITVLKLNPDGSEKLISTLVNPEQPIPPQASAVHGITDTDVADEPLFKQYAKSINEFLTGCDICGYNVKRFDLPMLEAEFKRAGIIFSRGGRDVIDPMVIFHKKEPRDLKAAYKKYCGKDLVNGPRTEVDVRATVEILDAQLEIYEDVPQHTHDLHVYCCADGEDCWVDEDGKFIWSENEVICNFGKKHYGRKLRDIAADAPDYLQWIASSDFTLEVKELACKALRGEFPTPK
jgi:DNA polymerase-3 subunit epsilon